MDQLGDSDAAANLGRCYWRGEGVRADVVEAVSWYALQTDSHSLHRLAYC
jgi:TPR repeat protein